MRYANRWMSWLLVAALLAVCAATRAVEKEPAEKAAESDAKEADATEEDNPYAPSEELGAFELFEQAERMKGLPKSLQSRPGFGEGIVICAERVLKSNPDETMRAWATRTKMDGYHRAANWGDEKAQEKLIAFVEALADDKDEKVIHWAKFYRIEDRVLKAADAEPAELPKLLDEVAEFLKAEKLDDRHLRIASATVKLINRLPSDDDAATAYERFGKLFAGSTDDELHRYGERVAKAAEKPPEDFTGKQITIEGTLVDGGQFDLGRWKGKVVLVDFWATWCGPCKAVLPELAAIYEAHHDSGFEIIGVSVDEDKDALKEFLAETPLPWPTIADVDAAADARLSTKYGINAIPKLFLLDGEGKLVATDLHGKALVAKIEELLKKK